MLKVPTPHADVRRGDAALEMPNDGRYEKRRRLGSSISSKLSIRQADLDLEEFQPVAFFCLKRDSKPRIWFIKLMSWPWFERVSILVILVNCVTLGMYNPFDMDCVSEQCQVLERLETAIYVFFLVEMLVKWLAMGLFGKKGYFKDSWNKLDCFIVAAGTFELAYGEGEYLSAVRSIRVLRPLRAINRVPSIRILVTLLLDTLPMLGNVLAICFFIFAIFGIIGVQLWQGLLRSRCFPDQLNDTIIAENNLSAFYKPSFDEPDYVCSLPENNGLSKCDQSNFDYHDFSSRECNNSNATNSSSSPCENWHQYYTTCRDSGVNIFWGSISFDNIGIATVAIFQIITLEGWTDIMYKIQDAHSFWNWLYFVVLILLGSYFMTNLCLVVITSQFQETKQRETELLKLSRMRSRASVSTLSSSFLQQGCYTQILHYLEHLCRRLERRVRACLKREKAPKRRRVRPCMQLKNRKDNVKSIHHHHHHYHYYHHYVHHRPCQCPSEISDSPPTTSEPAGSAEVSSGVSPPAADHAVGITQDVQESRNANEGKRILVVPQIQVFAQAATALYTDADTNTSGEMVSTATANINMQGHGSSASVVTYSKTADPVSVAAQATTKTIEAACSCATKQAGEDNVHVITKAYWDSADSSDDNMGHSETKGGNSCWGKFRDKMKILVESARFTRVIMASIFLNTICMAVEHHGQPEKMTNTLEVFNILFTTIFALEMLGKIMAFGPYGYIKDAYNLFDGIIVIVSFTDIFADNETSGISVLRSFRLLRIFKLVRFMPALQRQLSVMIKTLDNVMTFLALLSLFIFTSSILGMHLFGAKYRFPDEDGQLVTSRANFDTLFWAVVTVFQVLTQEDWNVVLYDGMRSLSSWAALYFIFLMIIGNYILFNLLVAILVEGFADHSENERLSLKSERDQNATFYLSPKLRRNQQEKPDKELALSWPNINTLMRDGDLETEQSLTRCNSAPGMKTRSPKPQRCNSYLHVLTVDALESGHSTEESGKNERKRCTSPEDEDISLVKQAGQDGCSVNHNRNSFFKRRACWSLYLFSPENSFRQLMVKFHNHVWFDRVVLFFILFNCVVMALEEPGLDKNSKTAHFIYITQYIFTAIFTIEMSIKVISLGLIIGSTAYLKSGWNVIDGVLVLFSLVDLVVSLTTDTQSGILGVLRVFRAFRTLRPLRVINRAPELKLVVETLLSSLKPIGNVVLIAATFFTIFGILGVQLFKGKFYSCDLDEKSTIEIKNKSQCLSNSGKWGNNEYNFDNLARALLTLFVFATRDGWVSIMYSGVDAVGVDEQPQRDHSKWNVLYFVAFLLLAGFVVLNMLVGIVVENFHKCRDELLKEQNLHKGEKTEMEDRPRSNSISDIDYGSFPPWRQKMFVFVTHDYFDLAIAVVIAINVLCMAMEHYQQPQNLTLFLKYANYVFTILFIIEAILKILALGMKNYFRNKWNTLDMIIVILSIGGIILDELATSNLPMNPTIIRVMRVLRITRVLKLLKTAEGIRSLLDTVGKALPQVANLGMLFLLLFFIFGALGMELFGKISCEKVECAGLDRHAHFRNFGYAVLTLFRVSTGDNWNGILKDTIDSKRCQTGEIEGCEIIQNIAPIYFASFVLITQFVLLNVVVAVMMKHLEESKIDEGKTVKNQSPRTPRLFLGTPNTPRRSKSSPRILRGSQSSFRSGRSETGILKKKGSPNSGSGQRRAKSMDEIRNNNNALILHSGSESDSYIDDTILRKTPRVITADLRQRKPSLEHEHSHEMVKIEKETTSANSKSSTPALEIVELDDRVPSVAFVKSSERLAKSMEKLPKSSENLVDHSTSFIEPFTSNLESLSKPSEPAVKCPENQPGNPDEPLVTPSIPFVVNLEDGNDSEIDGMRNKEMQGKDLVQSDADPPVGISKESRSGPRDGEGGKKHMTKNGHLGKSGDGEKFSKENKEEKKIDNAKEKLLKEDEIMKKENKVQEKLSQENKGRKKTDNVKEKLLKECKAMKDEDEKLHVARALEKTGEQKKVVEEGMKNEIEEDGLKSGLEEWLENKGNIESDKSKDVGREQGNVTNSKHETKDDKIKGGETLQKGECVGKDGALNVEQNLRQEIRRDTSTLDLDQKKRQEEEQDLKTDGKQRERKEKNKEDEPLGLDKRPEVNSMDNLVEIQDVNKEHLGLDVASQPKDNKRQRREVKRGSQENLIDRTNEEADSHEEEGNTRKRFHGIRLEPLPDNVTKLTPPGSVV